MICVAFLVLHILEFSLSHDFLPLEKTDIIVLINVAL